MIPVEKTVGRGWMFLKVLRRANGTLYKLATAVWANTIKIVLSAVLAKSAFKAANANIIAFRRQVYVTAFAVRFQCQHVHFHFGVFEL